MRIKAKKVETEEFRPLKWPPIFPLDKGLVAWYSFDDRSGAVLRDRSGKGNHGTLVNTTWVAGCRGSAIRLNGTSAYVTIANSTNLNFTSEPFTLVVLAKLSRISDYPYLLTKGNWSVAGYMLQIYSNGRIYFGTNQLGAYQVTYSNSGDIVLNAWTHVIVTRLGSAAKIYVDGIDKTAVAGTHINPASSTVYALLLGRLTTSYLQGTIALARVYNRALSATEAKRLAESELMLVRH